MTGAGGSVSHSVNHIYQMLTVQNSASDRVWTQSGLKIMQKKLWTSWEAPNQFQVPDSLFAGGTVAAGSTSPRPHLGSPA